VPLTTTNYVYSGCIDVFILLDRIATFNSKVKKLLKYNAYKVCFVLFIFSIAIEIPDDMGNMPSSVTVQLNSTENFTVWFLNNTPFAASKLGKTILITIYILRDFGGLMTQIILNLVSMYFLKAHLNKKMKITSRKTDVPGMSVTGANFACASVIGSTVQPMFTAGQSTNNIKPKRETAAKSSEDRISSVETKATMMVIIICILSAIEHLLVLISYIYPLINVGLTTFILYSIANFFWVLRRFFDFALFYMFNNNFRKVCSKYFSR
jgi:hypothetical protein